MLLSSIGFMLESRITGVVPEGEPVKEALNLRYAVSYTYFRSKVSRKYLEIARKVNGDIIEERVSFLARVFGR